MNNFVKVKLKNLFSYAQQITRRLKKYIKKRGGVLKKGSEENVKYVDINFKRLIMITKIVSKQTGNNSAFDV